MENETMKSFTQKAKSLFEQKKLKKGNFIEQFGHIRVPQMLNTSNGVYSVVGGSIYKQTKPGGYNFVNLIHDHVLLFFGEPYLEEQEKKPLHLRHPALQWMYKYVEQSEKDRTYKSGAGAAWFRFAFDLYTIKDNSTLEELMKERLLDANRFQSARHELWTAALFIAANFEINFENEVDNIKKHPEFVAIDRETAVNISVEAKSRHRKGIKGFSGGSKKSPGEEVGARGLLIDAFQKESGLPLYIFIDVNLPPQSLDRGLENWILELDKMMDDLSSEGYSDPCPANAIYFYNDPSHYLEDEQIGQEFDKLWFKYYLPKNPKIPNELTSALHKRIMMAFSQRISPPELLPGM